MVVAEFGTGQVFWSMLWFFLWFLWIWLLIVVFGDIFRSPDLSGWGKALWTIFVIIIPFLGVFVYLIARGGKMQDHAAQAAAAQDAAMRQYVQSVAPTPVAPARPTRSPVWPSCATTACSPRPSSSRPRPRRWRSLTRCRSTATGAPGTHRAENIVRSPADVLRLIVAAVVLVVVLVVDRLFGDTLVTFTSDLLRGSTRCPTG